MNLHFLIRHTRRMDSETWASAFNLDPYEGQYIGWNGYCYLPEATGRNAVWRNWRMAFWNGLSQGMSVPEALTYADQSLPSYAIQPNPSSYSSTFGPKRITVGYKDNNWP